MAVKPSVVEVGVSSLDVGVAVACLAAVVEAVDCLAVEGAVASLAVTEGVVSKVVDRRIVQSVGQGPVEIPRMDRTMKIIRTMTRRKSANSSKPTSMTGQVTMVLVAMAQVAMVLVG